MHNNATALGPRPTSTEQRRMRNGRICTSIALSVPAYEQVTARTAAGLGKVAVASRDAMRYYNLLKAHMPTLNGRELTILLAAYNAHPTRDHTRLHLTLYCEAEPTEAALRLGRKINALSEVEQLALLDGCERYARSSEQHPIRRISEAGLA